MNDIAEGKVRVVLESDLNLIFNWRNHSDIREFMYSRHELTESEHKNWYKLADSDPDKYLLIYEENKIPLGFVQFRKIRSSNVASWGFYVAPQSPKGTGFRLARNILAYAFKNIGLEKVCGEAISYNHKSIRLHESLGFIREGVLRNQYFDGQSYYDVIAFGILKNEWVRQPKKDDK